MEGAKARYLSYRGEKDVFAAVSGLPTHLHASCPTSLDTTDWRRITPEPQNDHSCGPASAVTAAAQEVVSALRTNLLYARRERFDREVGLDDEHEVVRALVDVEEYARCGGRDALRVAAPFCAVVRLESTTGAITAAALLGVGAVVASTKADSPNAVAAMSEIASCLSACRFEETDRSTDETAILALLDVAATTVEACVRSGIQCARGLRSLFNVCCTARCESAASSVLRTAADSALTRIVRAVFNNVSRADIQDENASDDADEENDLEATGHIARCLGLLLDPTRTAASAEVRVSLLRVALVAVEASGSVAPGGRLARLLSVDVCIGVIICASTVDEPDALRLCLRLILHVFRTLRSVMKVQLEVCLVTVHLDLTLDENAAPERREVALQSLVDFCLEPNLLADLYANYDCDVNCTNLFEALVSALATTAGNYMGAPDDKQACRQAHVPTHPTSLSRLAVRALLAAVDSLANRCRQPDPGGSVILGSSSGRWLTDARQRTARALRERNCLKTRLFAAAVAFNAGASNWVDAVAHAYGLGDYTTVNLASAVATFLRETPGLDKRRVGDVLGAGPADRRPLEAAVRNAYVSALDLGSDSFDAALRGFLAGFHLPGEAQCIDRLMEAFAQRLFAQWRQRSTVAQRGTVLLALAEERVGRCNDHDESCNNPTSLDLRISAARYCGNPFKTADAAFVLAFSTIMLQTDLHNPAVAPHRKMSLTDFIRNNRGINDGEDLPVAFLAEVYESIRQWPLAAPTRLTGDVAGDILFGSRAMSAATAQASTSRGFQHTPALDGSCSASWTDDNEPVCLVSARIPQTVDAVLREVEAGSSVRNARLRLDGADDWVQARSVLVSRAAFTAPTPLSNLLVAGAHECEAFAILAPAFCRAAASLLDRTTDAKLAATLTAGLARLPDAAAYFDTAVPVDAATLVLVRRARADLAAAIDAALYGQHLFHPGDHDDRESLDDDSNDSTGLRHHNRPGYRHCFEFRIAAAVAIATPRVDLLGPVTVRGLVDLALDLVDCGSLPDTAINVDDGEVPGGGRGPPRVAIVARAPWLCARLACAPSDARLSDCSFFGFDTVGDSRSTSESRAIRGATLRQSSSGLCAADDSRPKANGLLAVAASWLRSSRPVEHIAADAPPLSLPSRRAKCRALFYAAPSGSAVTLVRQVAAQAWTVACAPRTPATDIGWAPSTSDHAAGNNRQDVCRVSCDIEASARSALCRAAASAAAKRRNDGATALDWAWRLVEADVWCGGTGVLAAWPEVHKACIQACTCLADAPYAADRAAALVAHAASAWLGRGADDHASALTRELDHAAATTVDALTAELTASVTDYSDIAVSAAARLGLGVAAAAAAAGVNAIGSGRLRNAIALVAAVAPDALPGAARDVLLAAARRDRSADVSLAWLAVRDAVLGAARACPPRPAALVGLHRLLVDLARIRACLAMPDAALRDDIIALYYHLDRSLGLDIPDLDPALVTALHDLLAHTADLLDHLPARLKDLASPDGTASVPPIARATAGGLAISPAALHGELGASGGLRTSITGCKPHVV